jgi:hypothetical protein
MNAYYYAKEKDSDCIYGVLYSLFWFTCLWWVVPYSILTANNGSWMTRSLPQAAGAPAGLPESIPGADAVGSTERLAA